MRRVGRRVRSLKATRRSWRRGARRRSNPRAALLRRRPLPPAAAAATGSGLLPRTSCASHPAAVLS
eukprot:1618099-Prymnesium_polylepis.1